MSVESVRQRLVTAVLVILPLLVVIFLLPRIFGVLLLAAMALAGAWEWGAFFDPLSQLRRGLLVLAVAAGMALAWYVGAAAVMPILWVAVAWWVVAFVWLLRFPTPIPAWLILMGSFLVLIPGWLALAQLQLHGGPPFNADSQINDGPQWLTFFFVLIAAADSGAYFTGRAFGKTRLAPNVSPGKTWEGAIGGLIFAGVIASLAAIWFGLSPVFLVSLCLAVTMASIVGDLTISMFKRHAGLKDSGRLFPGHGGVLDRIDSISAGGPLFVIGLGWFQRIA